MQEQKGPVEGGEESPADDIESQRRSMTLRTEDVVRIVETVSAAEREAPQVRTSGVSNTALKSYPTPPPLLGMDNYDRCRHHQRTREASQKADVVTRKLSWYCPKIKDGAKASTAVGSTIVPR